MREFPTVYVVVEHSHYWDDEVLVTTSNAVAGFYNLNEAEEFCEEFLVKCNLAGPWNFLFQIDKIKVK